MTKIETMRGRAKWYEYLGAWAMAANAWECLELEGMGTDNETLRIEGAQGRIECDGIHDMLVTVVKRGRAHGAHLHEMGKMPDYLPSITTNVPLKTEIL